MLKPFSKLIEQSQEERDNDHVSTIVNFDGEILEVNVDDGGEGIFLGKTDQLALRDILLEMYPIHVVQKDY